MVTGTISSLNLPAFLAASALFCEAVANLSCSSRVICHWRGGVSAGRAAGGAGPEPRAAHLVHAPGGRTDRNAGGDGRLPRRVLALARGQHLTHDDFVDIGRIDLGPLERRLDGN